MSVQSVIPTLWIARLLKHLDNALVARTLFNTDYEGEISKHGDTVKINRVGDVTIKDYEKTDIDAPEDISTTDLTLVIDQMKYFNFSLDDVDKVQAEGKDLIDRTLERAAYGLLDIEDKFLFGLIDTDVKGKSRLTGNEIRNARDAYLLLIAMRTQLNKQNVPQLGRTAVLPAELTGALLAEKFIIPPTEKGDSRMTNGYIGRAIGFDIYESNNLVGTETGKKVIAGHNLGATRAEQILNIDAYRPERRFSDALKGLHVYGGKVTIPQAYVVAETDYSKLFKPDEPATETDGK